MTARRDLKRLVRERQAKTGESYVTARRHVIAQAPDEPPERPAAIPVVEMLSLTEEAHKLGMQCRVTIESTLAKVVDPSAVLQRVLEAVLATEDDPGMQVLRSVVLRGEVPVFTRRGPGQWLGDWRRFLTRVAAGIGGVSESGTMLALHVDGPAGAVMVIAHIGLRPLSSPRPTTDVPRLVLIGLEGLEAGPDPATASWLVPMVLAR